MHMTIRETLEMTGFCPYLQQDVSVDATYQKYSPLGDPNTYAVFSGINCPNSSECPDSSACPVALQRTYW